MADHAERPPSPPLGSETMPDWVACNVKPYKVLQETSAQIVLNCKDFGLQLQGVCGRAEEQLPGSASEDFVCTDTCFEFLSAFKTLSLALIQLSADLESAVSMPLQTTIATLTEETRGRLKHWKQVRGRFAELQDKYSRSRQKSLESKVKLGKASESKASVANFFKSSSSSGPDKAAAEQHARMLDLAKCEEDLCEGEASLRLFEDESRKRLLQLEREKQALLQGALTQGASSLGRLRILAEKTAAVGADGASSSKASEKWQACDSAAFSGLVPGRRDDGEEGGGTAEGRKTPEEPAAPPVPAPAPDDMEIRFTPFTPEEPCQPAEPTPAAADPSRKYAQTVVDLGLEIEEPSDNDQDSADVALRAQMWAPPTAKGKPGKAPLVAGGLPGKKSLVFQSSNSSILTRPASNTPTLSRSPSKQERQGLPAPLPKADTAAVSVQPLLKLAVAPLWGGGDSAPAEVPRTPSQAEAGGEPPKTPPRAAVRERSADEHGWDAVPDVQGISASPSVASRASVSVSPDVRRGYVPSPIDDAEDEDDLVAPAAPIQLLEEPEVKIELTPLIAEDPKKTFERYVKRLPDRLAGATDTAWDKLQARAAEKLTGSHVGKLEFFWIHRLGVEASAEAADGLVCFQFVQGFASNFARILHLSVAGAGDGWLSILPSALLEVRQLLFSTLPVDSVRAVVLAGEDEQGRIYVDRDVEVAYQRCRFRWFQLTQNLRRTRSALTGKSKMKLNSRFLVLHVARSEKDPSAPRASAIQALPAALLSSDPAVGIAAAAGDASGAAQADLASIPSGPGEAPPAEAALVGFSDF